MSNLKENGRVKIKIESQKGGVVRGTELSTIKTKGHNGGVVRGTELSVEIVEKVNKINRAEIKPKGQNGGVVRGTELSEIKSGENSEKATNSKVRNGGVVRGTELSVMKRSKLVSREFKDKTVELKLKGQNWGAVRATESSAVKIREVKEKLKMPKVKSKEVSEKTAESLRTVECHRNGKLEVEIKRRISPNIQKMKKIFESEKAEKVTVSEIEKFKEWI